MFANDPLSQSTLTGIFKTNPDDPLKIINREGNRIEFKESFNFSNMAQYFKTMASFANREGGYILFGVGEKPRRLLGLKEKSLDQFDNLDAEVFTNHLNDHFSPEIKWDRCTFKYKGLDFGVIYTLPLTHKPCVCIKTHDDPNKKYTLNDGDIYYRYAGRSQKIKHPELMAILEEERDKERNQWIDLIKNAVSIGSENVALLDLSSGSLKGSGGSIFIDNELLDKLAFVKEGHFVDNGGTPTLRVIGEAELSTGKIIVKEKKTKEVKAIEPDDIISFFFTSIVVEEPLEYIRCVCSQSSANYPIYYYLKMSGKDKEEVLELIKETNVRGNTKQLLIDRLNGKRVERKMAGFSSREAGLKKQEYYNKWISKSIPDTIDEPKYCLDALMHLSDSEITERLVYIKDIIYRIYQSDYETMDGNTAGLLRKTICRLDEVENYIYHE